MEPWVLFDVNNLAWRAFHSTGSLKHADGEGGVVMTGVLYGVLREVRLQLDRHCTTNAVFAFDSRDSVRRQAFSGYKEKRSNGPFSREQQLNRDAVWTQLAALKDAHLPALGFPNLLQESGFEADDMIGAACRALGGQEKHLVSNDKDLYQLVDENTVAWTPGRNGTAVGLDRFVYDWRLEPDRWADIKSIAGCKSDCIPGVVGVGEVTAAAYLRGEKVSDKKQDAIAAFLASDQHARNLTLIKLPHPGCPTLRKGDLKKSKSSDRKWADLFGRLGVTSL